MKISVNTLRYNNEHYASTDNTELRDLDLLVEKIGAQLGAVEEVVKTGPRYDGIVVAQIVACVDHPDADRLHVCTIDDGGVVKDVARNADGHVEVVCGAPNVREGLTVAWIPPGVTVPSTVDKDPFVLEARDIRGVVSNGMLGSARELGISDEHDGILEIAVDEVGAERAKPGQPFNQLYGLDDAIIDIENKMFTHRPDCFGHLGVAREIAGIQGVPYRSPEWYLQPEIPEGQTSDAIKGVNLKNEVPELCPRYMLMAVDNVTIAPSPTWLQAFLSRIGVRPINNIVDMTNYMMVLTGQPLHAFDFDKVAKNGQATIVVRKPHEGEKLGLLDGRTIEPRADAILICDEEKPIGLGGMLGGNNSEIDDQTTRILIECASFDMYNIRRSSMEHGIFTDAVTRFTKGQSPWQCPAVLYKAIAMVQELCPEARPIGHPVDDFPVSTSNPAVTVAASFINERLGTVLEVATISELLQNVEFIVEPADDDSLTVTAPFWRTDIEIPEDIVEEVGRLYGYDKLPLTLPVRAITPAKRNPLFDLRRQIRGELSRAGANEILTYSFVHGNLLDKVGQARDQAFQLSNALSPDLQYYRQSLTPSLLEKVHPNIKAGYEQFALFELGKTHIKGLSDPSEPEVPKELQALGLVFSVDDKATEQYKGSAYYQAANYLRALLGVFRAEKTITLELLKNASLYDNSWVEALVAPFEPNRSAVLLDAEGLIWGIVGEYKASVRKALKLPLYTAGFELDPMLFLIPNDERLYHPLPRFPKVSQDITLRVSSDVAFSGLSELLQSELQTVRPEQSYFELTPLSIYQKDDEHKHVSFRLEIASYERTLTTEEVNKLLDGVAAAAHKVLQAERV